VGLSRFSEISIDHGAGDAIFEHSPLNFYGFPCISGLDDFLGDLACNPSGKVGSHLIRGLLCSIGAFPLLDGLEQIDPSESWGFQMGYRFLAMLFPPSLPIAKECVLGADCASDQ
jgi:hypothetical protein